MSVWREKSAATIVESIWERKKGVLMVEDSNTKLRRIKRLNL
jgi:hypothetical protein